MWWYQEWYQHQLESVHQVEDMWKAKVHQPHSMAHGEYVQYLMEHTSVITAIIVFDLLDEMVRLSNDIQC